MSSGVRHPMQDAAAATGAGTVAYPQNPLRLDYGIFQVEITGTATVQMQGRVDENFSWHTLETYTASGADKVAVFPHMRANISAYSSGEVTAVLIA